MLPQLIVLVGLLHRLDGCVVDLPQPLESRWRTRRKRRKDDKNVRKRCLKKRQGGPFDRPQSR